MLTSSLIKSHKPSLTCLELYTFLIWIFFFKSPKWTYSLWWFLTNGSTLRIQSNNPNRRLSISSKFCLISYWYQCSSSQVLHIWYILKYSPNYIQSSAQLFNLPRKIIQLFSTFSPFTWRVNKTRSSFSVLLWRWAVSPWFAFRSYGGKN